MPLLGLLTTVPVPRLIFIAGLLLKSLFGELLLLQLVGLLGLVNIGLLQPAGLVATTHVGLLLQLIGLVATTRHHRISVADPCRQRCEERE